MISSNGSNGEDTLRDDHSTAAATAGGGGGGGDLQNVSSSSNVLFHIEGSHEASPDQKSPDGIKVNASI